MYGRAERSAGRGRDPRADGSVAPTTPTRLSWTTAGSGPLLLLLHGLGATRDDFARLRRLLESAYQVLMEQFQIPSSLSS
jgi:pimeloyl-ACP methyl ester carboxylesterase